MAQIDTARHDRPSLRSVLRGLLEPTGLLPLARRVKWHLQARGWLRWTPLVSSQQYSAGCDSAIQKLREDGHSFGSYLEFGVSRGTSMSCMHHALRKAGLSDITLFGFDSFEGMPAEAAEQGWDPGRFASAMSMTERYLGDHGVDVNDVRLVKGWFQDTLTDEAAAELGIEKASLIMVDCDIYSASKEALTFCAPLIKDKAIIFFDDWGSRFNKGAIGQNEAFNEFIADNPDLSAEPLAAYSSDARVFLVHRSGGQT
ncbi:MAG: TylF/MycF/NovP-related O-methyltransferase [Pseudomonadota bacterium]